ncbi:ATP-binding protein [Vibrio sp. Isolate23]|uniref:ATP-binding protein n=1 Tax=Vibrio sp. Isolate23 TaxID=2908533 RepID=UPI001EFDF372|nr:ATP-binding protein [Vibrio sp. Isolate23]MCG9682435.1 ATP-binding protein [Vibrio sp. Isolate23]
MLICGKICASLVELFISMTLKLTIIRGLPGSGKSTLARTLGVNHYEADMYFIDAQGDYIFRPEDISKAHDWCKTMTRESLLQRQSVVVSNTFVMRWEIIPYYKMAQQYDAVFEVIECKQDYGNIHGVPASTILEMKKRWQEWRREQL